MTSVESWSIIQVSISPGTGSSRIRTCFQLSYPSSPPPFLCWPRVMSREHDLGRAPSPWNYPNPTPAATADPQATPSQQNHGQLPLQPRNNFDPSPPNTGRQLERPNVPTRSATVRTPDPDRNLASNIWNPQSRSEDLNHSFSSSSQGSTYLTTSPRPSPALLSSAGSSRPSTPGGTQNLKPRSSSGHSDDSDQHLSANSHVSAASFHSNAVKQTSVASSHSASLASS